MVVNVVLDTRLLTGRERLEGIVEPSSVGLRTQPSIVGFGVPDQPDMNGRQTIYLIYAGMTGQRVPYSTKEDLLVAEPELRALKEGGLDFDYQCGDGEQAADLFFPKSKLCLRFITGQVAENERYWMSTFVGTEPDIKIGK